jgi:hypothetical protein
MIPDVFMGDNVPFEVKKAEPPEPEKKSLFGVNPFANK